MDPKSTITLPTFVKPTDPNFVSPAQIVPYTVYGVDLTAHSHPESKERRMIWGQNSLMIETITGSRKMKLHPLDRLLADEIEYNGEKVCLHDILFEAWRNKESSTSHPLSDSPDNKILFNRFLLNLEAIERLPYWAFELMVKYYFDVFGLIPKGLAEAIKSE